MRVTPAVPTPAVPTPAVPTLALLTLALALASCVGATYRDTSVAMEPVPMVDLARYQGVWFEIARFPNWFERGCEGTTADYGIRPDGRVDVLNACRKGGLDGRLDSVRGIARPVDASNARLKVKFVQWLPFEGDYWVLHLDADYRTAVVGTPSGSTGWILSRTPQIDPERLEAALAALRRNGYDVERLDYVAQPGG